MDSVKAAQKRIAKKKQVYKPILDNPYTNENELWPTVVDQAVVLELLEAKVLRPFKLSRGMAGAKSPVDVVVGYDEVMEYLGGKEESVREGILFVCNKDSTPSVLLSQVPIAAYMSDYAVTLVQLPRGTLSKFSEYLQDRVHDGLLFVPVTNEVDTVFVQKVKENVQGRELKWLDLLKYKPAPVKLLRTTRPLAAKAKDL